VAGVVIHAPFPPSVRVPVALDSSNYLPHWSFSRLDAANAPTSAVPPGQNSDHAPSSNPVVMPSQCQRDLDNGMREGGGGGSNDSNQASRQVPALSGHQLPLDERFDGVSEIASVESIPTVTRKGFLGAAKPNTPRNSLKSDSGSDALSHDELAIGKWQAVPHTSIDTFRVDKDDHLDANVPSGGESDAQAEASIATIGKGVVYVSLAPMSRAHTRTHNSPSVDPPSNLPHLQNTNTHTFDALRRAAGRDLMDDGNATRNIENIRRNKSR
jgi:hypothetical protein